MTRLRCSLPAWLALAAMLVIFLAPVLSQTLALAHERERAHSSAWHTQSVDMPAGHAMAMQPTQNMHQVGAVQDDRTHPAGHMDLTQCGYCSLLAHTPLMAETALAMPPSRAGPDPTPVFARLQGHARHPHFPNALSRAPPLSA
ncbi:DUF2946 domain-containing protein [Kushneria phyllosphaerae]|uniref:DUF2946 domain-containing protein n=1 Tax=Kushneria phyllosphaerae TaxID=2100822 RepID=A0A2R8CJ78_9GAMM|nr:DUF2946 domain-containing protein [Kushneria phyllosphaerae]SPJ32945.1 hypothetical protein KSP9073_00947 [Kushneria phyllosphaerae]